MTAVPPPVPSIGLLYLSNGVRTFAWYAHVRNLAYHSWSPVALASWRIALVEHPVQVPAKRFGCPVLNLVQLKMPQQVIALTVFVPCAVFAMHEPVRPDFLWGGLRLEGAVFFPFRPQILACLGL